MIFAEIKVLVATIDNIYVTTYKEEASRLTCGDGVQILFKLNHDMQLERQDKHISCMDHIMYCTIKLYQIIITIISPPFEYHNFMLSFKLESLKRVQIVYYSSVISI